MIDDCGTGHPTSRLDPAAVGQRIKELTDRAEKAEAALAESQTVRGVLDKALDEERRIRKMAEAARDALAAGLKLTLPTLMAYHPDIHQAALEVLDQHAPGWRGKRAIDWNLS